ncbi:MAG TPA: hypothetical protein VGB85_34290 [Nannocystis sp.]
MLGACTLQKDLLTTGDPDSTDDGAATADDESATGNIGNTGGPGSDATGDTSTAGDTASGSEGSSDTTPAEMCPPDGIDMTISSGVGCDAEMPDYIGKPLPTNLSANCAASPEKTELWESEAEMTGCIVGQWLACPGFTVSGVGSGVGLEFTADGKVIRLLLDENCEVVRGTGIDHVGTWEYGDVGTGDGPNGLRYTWDPDQNGWLTTAPLVTTNPEQMRAHDGRLARP